MSKLKLPKSLATCADMYYKAREDRLALQKQVDELAAREVLIKDHLIDNLPKSEATGVQGKLCRVSVVTKVKPVVEDWDEFYKYIKKTGAFEMLQKRLSDTAIAERWENKKDVPGVGRFNAVTLSVNKVK